MEDVLIRGAAKALFSNGRYIVTAPAKKIDATDTDILIDLDLHSAGSTGTGMMRSLAASAP